MSGQRRLTSSKDRKLSLRLWNGSKSAIHSVHIWCHMRSSSVILALLIVLPFVQIQSTFAQVSFEDVTVAAGVDYLHWDGGFLPCIDGLQPGCTELLYMSAGAAAGDYDNDGWVDLYVTRIDAPNLLFRNLGDGTFSEVGVAAGVALNSYSTGCSWADVDNDSDLDLFITTLTERNYLYINDGSGSFVESAVAWGVDLPSPLLLRNRAGASFGDYDNDGLLDLHITEWLAVPGSSPLLRNTGAGSYTIVPNNSQLGFASGFADVDMDGFADLLIAADFGFSKLWKNPGSAPFMDITSAANVGTDENGMGSAIGDIDNDGDFDWFVTSIFDPDDICSTASCNWGTTGNRLYINDSTGTFTDNTTASGVRDGAWGWGATFFDFDNDGDLDLGMTNGVDFPTQPEDLPYNDDALRLWQNDGTGVMTEVAASLGLTDLGSGKAYLVFDYDKDGDLDIFIANNAGNPVLYRNNGGNTNSWLRVKLRGSITNSFGVGAIIRVKVTAGGTTQMRQISANNNYMSQNEAIAHFGLGPGVTSISSVEVFWPASNITTVMSNVAANQLILIAEVAVPVASDWGVIIVALSLAVCGTVLITRKSMIVRE